MEKEWTDLQQDEDTETCDSGSESDKDAREAKVSVLLSSNTLLR